MKKPFLNTMFGSYLKVFVTVMLTQYLAMGKGLFDLDLNSIKVLVSGAVASTIPVIINALNKKDPRYGNMDKKDTEIVDKDGTV